MRKKFIIISILTVVIFIGIICLKNISYGSKKYKIPNSNITLEVPAMSSLKEECCMFSATFKSFSSSAVIQKELDTIISKYEKKICNNKIVYYNDKEDIAIVEYGVKPRFIINEFYINYDKGKYDVDSCSVINDPTKLTYDVTESNRDADDCNGPITYKNKDGKIYNLHYNWCFGHLLFQTGTGKMNYLYAMLGYGWISMQDVIDFLEYQVENGEASKKIFEDDNSTLYRNKDFTLLSCNTLSGNKDIYIDGADFEYNQNYCKW